MFTKRASRLGKDLGRRLADLCQQRDPQPRLGPNDHPSVFFTLANGRVITAATSEQVKDIAGRVGDGQIVKMVAQGHGCDNAQFLGSWDRSSKQGFVVARDGHIELRNARGEEIGDFSKLFGKKFRSRQSLIVYQGCFTARDNQKNLAKATGEAMPGVSVIGNENEGWGWAHVLKTPRGETIPPLSAGGYSTEAREYYRDPSRPAHHARLVNFYQDDILR